MQHLLSYLYKNDIKELKKKKKKSFLFFQYRLLILLCVVGIWMDFSVSYSGKCSVVWKISFDKPTKDLFVKEVYGSWQKEALGVYNSFHTE